MINDPQGDYSKPMFDYIDKIRTQAVLRAFQKQVNPPITYAELEAWEQRRKEREELEAREAVKLSNRIKAGLHKIKVWVHNTYFGDCCDNWY